MRISDWSSDVCSSDLKKKNLDNFSPKITLDYRLDKNSLVYASFQRGFKSGTYNILNIYTPTQYIKPETVTSTEIGLKSELFDHRVRFKDRKSTRLTSSH